MCLRLRATSSRARACAFNTLQVLLLSFLLSITWVPSTIGQPDETDLYTELRCTCVDTISKIHPRHINSLEMIKPTAHCATVEVIATLKGGRKICLDPEAPAIKKILQKILEGY